MSDLFALHAEPRSDKGKGASRRLRREQRVPAIIYGGEKPPQAVSLDAHEVERSTQHEAFYSHILQLTVDGKSEQVIVRDMQRHPYRHAVLHMDFQRIQADQALTVSVPIHFTGEAECIGVKLSGGAISHIQTEVEVSCLPKDLPEYLEVDLSNVDIGESVLLSDLNVPDGVTIVALSHGEEYNVAIATVHVKAAADADTDEEGQLDDQAGDSSTGSD